jgi:hypothetical protein
VRRNYSRETECHQTSGGQGPKSYGDLSRHEFLNARELRQPLPDGALRIVARGVKEDAAPARYLVHMRCGTGGQAQAPANCDP